MWARRAVWCAAGSLACLACASRGEPPACLDRRQEARNHALRGEVEQAQSLLDRVKAECGPNSQSDIAHITKLIAEKTSARAEKERRAQSRNEALEKYPSRSFVDWASERGGEIAGKLPSVPCAERGTPAFGFCEGQRADAPGMSLRYWQAQPDAYRYSLETDTAASCQDLGEYRQVRAWSRDGSDYELCELTNRRLRHLSALITRAGPHYRMDIFSTNYPAIDPDFELRLRVILPPAPGGR